MNPKTALLILVVFIVILSCAGDYSEAKAQDEHCREMVAQGAWPKEVCDAI